MDNLTDKSYVNGPKPHTVIGENGKQINPDWYILANAKYVCSIHAKGMKMRGITLRGVKAKLNLKSNNWKDAEKEVLDIMDKFKLAELTTTPN